MDEGSRDIVNYGFDLFFFMRFWVWVGFGFGVRFFLGEVIFVGWLGKLRVVLGI